MMKHTYWSPHCLAAPPPTKHTWSHPRKIFNDCTTSYVLISGVTQPNLTKFLQDTEMIAHYFSEIKIAIFLSVSERQSDEWRSSLNCVLIAAKNAHFNSVNFEIIGWKFTRFVHNVGGLLPFNLSKADLQSANSLSNAEAKSQGRTWRCLRTSPKFNWLP